MIYLVWSIWLFVIVFNVIMLLNFLIAFISETYEEVYGRGKIDDFKMAISIIPKRPKLNISKNNEFPHFYSRLEGPIVAAPRNIHLHDSSSRGGHSGALPGEHRE